MGFTGIPKTVDDPQVTVADCRAALRRLVTDLHRVDSEELPELRALIDRWLERLYPLVTRCPDLPPA